MGSWRLNRSWIMVLGGKEVLSSPDKRFLCYSTFSFRVRVLFCVKWTQYWSAQSVPAVCHAGTGEEGSRWFKVGGWPWTPEHLSPVWSSPTTSLYKGWAAGAVLTSWGFSQVYDLLLALLWGHLHFPERGSGACHTTPAGDQRLEASKDVGSQGTVHKMTSRISYPGCMGGGVRWQSGTFPGKQLSNGWALHKCWAAGREPVPHLPGASNLLCGVILHRYLPDGAAH